MKCAHCGRPAASLLFPAKVIIHGVPYCSTQCAENHPS